MSVLIRTLVGLVLGSGKQAGVNAKANRGWVSGVGDDTVRGLLD